MLNILKNLSAIITILILSSCNVRDNNDNCGVYLEFRYDYNMKYTDLFSELIETVDVFIFDSEGKFLLQKHSPSSELINGNRMKLQDNMPFGKYQIVTVGGLSEDFNISDIDDNVHVSGVTTIESIKLALKRNSAEVARNFKNIWVSDIITLNYQADLTVWPVSFIQNTNTFDIRIESADNKSLNTKATSPFTFEVISPEGGAYASNNSHLMDESVVYKPYELSAGSSVVISQAYIKTMRLINGITTRGGYKLNVLDISTGEKIWEYDLMSFLRDTKPAFRPDNTVLPMQEYLDRQSYYEIVLIVKNKDEGFIAVAIKINGWIIWLNDIEV